MTCNISSVSQCVERLSSVLILTHLSAGGVLARTNKYIWLVIGATNTTSCQINFPYKKIGLFPKVSFTFNNPNQYKSLIPFVSHQIMR